MRAKTLAIALANGALYIENDLVQRLWRLRLMDMGRGARVARNAKIYGSRQVSIGANSMINDYVHVWGTGGVTIGDDCLIAAHVVITSQSHSSSALRDGKLYRQTNTAAHVTIGSNVWIGSNACILPGVSIGADSIVGAGAVVIADVPEASLVAGVPARILRSLR